ncbi:hypothetical protein EJB05_13016, partial [Eragrostis curvula]
MAEAIVISLSAKLGVALSRSAGHSLSSLFGVRSDIVLLRAFLQHADDSRRGTDSLAAAWVRQVRDAAFELEDVADECCYLSGRGHGLARDVLNVGAWHALSRRLRKARERLRHLTAAKEQYGIRPLLAETDDHAPFRVATTTTTTTTDVASMAERAHFLEKEEIVGFAAHEARLLEWVAGGGDADPRRKVVAVCGMGGVGKTTLVTRVYKEATSSFECAAWVSVSRGFTVDDLLKKILKELRRGGGADDDDDYRSLVQSVRARLGKRRYLVVLDDVWDAQLWDRHLRHAFLDDEASGSRVVITTRSGEVAKAAATAGMTVTLEPLPWPEAWTLFCNVAFRTPAPDRTCPSHLQEVAASMLERCRGLPLAIVSVGNVLALRDKTEFAWRNVRDSLVWDEGSSDLGIGEAASILNLSIDDLPHHLKQCFLSCSVYPEDFLVKRKMLIRNWVAQGFVDDKTGTRTAEDVADDYLDQLVQRSLMRAVVRNEFGRAKRCLIHDLIRELIIRRYREEEGFSQFAKCKVTTTDSSVRIRHLSVDRCEVDRQSVQKAASLRSFHAFGSDVDALFLSRFRLLTFLRVLYLCAIKKVVGYLCATKKFRDTCVP